MATTLLCATCQETGARGRTPYPQRDRCIYCGAKVSKQFNITVKVYTSAKAHAAGAAPLQVQPVGIVTARDEWQARTRAMYAFFKITDSDPSFKGLAGEFVAYDVTEVNS